MIPNGIQITVTPAERAALIENYKAVRALIAQMRQQFGDDPRRDAIVQYEFGNFGSWFKRFTKKVLAPAAKIGKAIIKSPITKLIVGGIATVYPAVGVPLSAALLVADKAIRMAEDIDKARQDIGKTLIMNTKVAAKTDPNAARAFQVMKSVHETRKAHGTPKGAPMTLNAAKAAAQLTATRVPLSKQTHVLPGLPAAIYKQPSIAKLPIRALTTSTIMVPKLTGAGPELRAQMIQKLKSQAAIRSTAPNGTVRVTQVNPKLGTSTTGAKPIAKLPKGTPLYSGFVVTTQGRIIPGAKIAKLAGDDPAELEAEFGRCGFFNAACHAREAAHLRDRVLRRNSRAMKRALGWR